MTPASGTSFIPIISTGLDGPASWIRLPLSSNMARTFPCLLPVTMVSPCLRVPVCTRAVAIDPRLRSIRASITTPLAFLSGFAFNSLISVTNRMFSISESTPSPVMPDTGTAMTSPPHSSTKRFCSESCLYTFCTSAEGKSFFVTAIKIGTSAALA